MKALISNALGFPKPEINRFDPISGGVFLTQIVYSNITKLLIFVYDWYDPYAKVYRET